MWIVLLVAGALALVAIAAGYLRKPHKTSIEVRLWLLDTLVALALLTGAVLLYRHRDRPDWDTSYWTTFGIGLVGVAKSLYSGHLKKQQASHRRAIR